MGESEAQIKTESDKQIAQANELREAKQKSDPLFGRRIHFWILIKKCLRGIVDCDFFIEPVTAKRYELSDEHLPFLRVESVWNDDNLWINVQKIETRIAQMS